MGAQANQGQLPMIDHVSLAVTDLDRSQRFYDAALAPLGILPDPREGTQLSYRREGLDDLTLVQSPTVPIPPHGTHTCFTATTRHAVREFHRAGLAAGGRDDGAPGLRPEYSADYYGAFLVDPDGHRVEAVCHASGEDTEAGKVKVG